MARVEKVAGCLDEPRHLVRAQDGRQPLRVSSDTEGRRRDSCRFNVLHEEETQAPPRALTTVPTASFRS